MLNGGGEPGWSVVCFRQAYDRLQVALQLSRKSALQEAAHGEKLQKLKNSDELVGMSSMGMQFQ